MTPAPVFDHQSITTHLLVALTAQAPPGWRAAPDLNVKIDHESSDYCRPDVCVLNPGEKGGLWHTFGQFGLLIEIASPSTRWIDDDEKLRLFARQEVPAYWRVQPAGDSGPPTVHVHTAPANGNYQITETVGPGGRLVLDVPFPFVLEPDLLVP